jgi:hypothetical protein
MSLPGLVHHFLYEKGHYKKLLPPEEFKKCERIVKNEPEGIYGPDDNESVQSNLDELHSTAIAYSWKKNLYLLKFKSPEELKDHLINIWRNRKLD